ncbi:hypothetical protein ACH42_12285 [Endozoicomonas sp. (ex Bugula neritina AB1)]|nr:hypothetical protein ACH42_12285 [Endozoicomonas sp. (ex Bugula neritina AB1)]
MTVWLKRAFILTITLLLLLILSAFLILRSSLPSLDGDISLSGVSGSVSIERDKEGVPKVTGSNRNDVAFATGYLHAQERFFQMDLGRRNSAGELSELFGKLALDHDKRQRRHQFRQVARKSTEKLSPKHKSLLEAYTNGVNRGLADLGSKPFEYWLLNLEPLPWRSEDSFLTVYSMYLDLNDDEVKIDNLKGFLQKVTSRDIIEFLSPLKTRWDSPLQPDTLMAPELPGKDEINIRALHSKTYANIQGTTLHDAVIGSNNWAVSGNLTNHGSAIVEDDMHLSHRVPTIWYRAQLNYPHPDDINQNVTTTGVTLPGIPVVVVGSNTHIAWGFTNTAGDWVDLVELEIEGSQYMTNNGPKPLETWVETIKVKDQEPVTIEYQKTHWGPIISSAYDDTQYALRWTAHSPEATNLNLQELETANDIFKAMNVANRSGIPPQNFTVGDSQGHIGWTVAGQIPNRSGIDSTYPLPWEEADKNWNGWLDKNDYPRVVNPSNNRIWTANARIVSDSDYQKMGNGGYALGPRQLQIRDALNELKKADEQALLDIALDHRALYMGKWRELILSTLTESTRAEAPGRQVFFDYVDNWSGAASTDDVGYRLTREFNDALNLKVMGYLGRYFQHMAPEVKEGIDDGYLQKLNHEREMLWRLLDEKPIHWLSSDYESWDQLLIETVDEVIADLGGVNKLPAATWGQRNTAKVNHPLSSALPVVGSLLNMPSVPLSGDSWMPRAQRPSQGVSERMIVSPGREENAIFHMPGGQSGHPLSPFFKKGYMNWVSGKASPFLPGKTEYTLVLSPQ